MASLTEEGDYPIFYCIFETQVGLEWVEVEKTVVEEELVMEEAVHLAPCEAIMVSTFARLVYELFPVKLNVN